MTWQELPHVDEHATVVTGDVWPALLTTMDQTFAGPAVEVYARLVGCADPRASGPRPLVAGSTVPGFRVAAVDPGRALVLVGRHRFSSYALVLRVEDLGEGRSRLSAQTRAAFPGVLGGAYRQALMRSGGHVLGVRRLLAAVRRRAERVPG